MSAARHRAGFWRGSRRGFTLVEVISAIVIMAIISTAVCALTFGALNSDRAMRSLNTSQSEIELTMRRMANNIREAQTGSITLGTSTLTTMTQADATHGYPLGAVVIYSLVNDPSASGQKMLVENDQRYGTNTLLHNVTTFNITAVAGLSDLYQVDLVTGGPMVAERHFKVNARN